MTSTQTLIPPGEPSLKAKLWQHPGTIGWPCVAPAPHHHPSPSGPLARRYSSRAGPASWSATLDANSAAYVISMPLVAQKPVSRALKPLNCHTKKQRPPLDADNTAIRVVHWLRHFSFVGYGAAPDLQDRMRTAIHRQLRWLEHSYSLQSPSTRLLILIALLHAACCTEEYADNRDEYINVLGR